MSFILTHELPDGNTPIRQENATQLIPRISTMGELNEYEALNILRAREWAFDPRTMKSNDPLDERYVRELHRRMFNNVWGWAAIYRRLEVNIGCEPLEIGQRIPQLLGNMHFWLDNKTFRPDEALVRFHHLLTRIHPFANGNGRHARMITDVVAVKHGQAEFTWGARSETAAPGDARSKYLAALRALDADENDVRLLLELSRS